MDAANEAVSILVVVDRYWIVELKRSKGWEDGWLGKSEGSNHRSEKLGSQCVSPAVKDQGSSSGLLFDAGGPHAPLREISLA